MKQATVLDQVRESASEGVAERGDVKRLAAEFRMLPLTQLHESPLNPRKHYEPNAMAELAASIRTSGIITPLVVRPNAGGFEIAAGHRRYRAAKLVDLAEAPCIVRPMSEAEFVEILSIENGRREDLTPLEEADGYRLLMTKAGYTVERIAERIGMSVKYVYDRVKLLQLIPAAQKLLREGTITAGHAILLARLNPKDQARAIGGPKDVERGGLLKYEHVLWDPEHQGRGISAEDGAVKPVSVREFQAWIDEHVKFDKTAVDAMLFPDTVQVIQTATAQAEREKIIQITHEFYVQPDARDAKERIFSERSWKRADGKKKSKSCEHAITGVIVVGPGRGDAFKVCIEKEKCAVHWAAWQRERKQRAGAAARGVPTGTRTAQDSYAAQEAKRKLERARAEAEQARWKKARPAILEALAAAVKKAPTRATGLLAEIVLEQLDMGYGHKDYSADYMPRGTTAEDLVRHAAFRVLMNELQEWSAVDEFPKRAKAFGLDVCKIVDTIAPPKPEPEKPQTSATKKAKT